MISNAYNTDRVLAAMRGRLGWQQPTRPGVPTLTTANTTATSGRYYGDGFHEAATLFRFYETQETRNIDAADFNTLLQQADDQVTLRCINAVFNRPQLIDNCLIYDRALSYNRPVALGNRGDFVGYQIRVSPGDYSAYVNRASLYFNAAATFNLYLFNDLRLAPLQTKEVSAVANDQVMVDLGWQLNYAGSSNMAGIFYVGYFQNDLGAAQALDEPYQRQANTTVFGAWPFESRQVTGQPDFDRRMPANVWHSYGLNLQMSSCHDYTETIVRNAHLFDEVRGLVMALRVLGTITNSLRSNLTERKANDQLAGLLMDMNLAFPTENLPYVAGIKSQVARELKRINENFFPKAQMSSARLGQGEMSSENCMP